MESVKDKVVLITGASSGIGAGTALEFAKYGSKLALTGRNQENLEAVGQQCQELGLSKDKVLLIIADVVKDDDVRRIIDTTVAKYGSIDVLVNVAGIMSMGSLESMTMEDYDKVQRVNVRSVCYISKLALPYLKQSKGNVVNLSSVSGFRPMVDNLAYCMSKATLNMFTMSLALELAADKVRVNAVNVGVVETPLFDRAGFAPDVVQGFLATTPRCIPARRNAGISEVAKTVIFLASDAASYISGALLPVDGGLTPTGSWTYLNRLSPI